MLRQRIPLLSAVLACLFIAYVGWAGRNSGGTYSLPAGNPVTTGTTITSSWANTTLSDMGTELTNSLDRQGRGSMSAPLKLANGTTAAPSLAWAAEPGSGPFRNAAGDIRWSILATDVLKLQSALVTTLVPLTVTGRTTTTNLTVSGTAERLIVTPTTPADVTAVVGNGLGTGSGLFGTGGVTNGIGVVGIGSGATGVGVSALGAPAGSGTGLTALGGVTAGTGATLTGGTGGVGAIAAAGTAASVTTPKDAFRVTNGYISLDGVVSPNPIATGNGAHGSTKNRLVPKSLTQAWASVFISGGTVSADDTYGVATIAESNPASCLNYFITVTFDQAFLNTTGTGPTSFQYAAVVSSRSSNIIAPHCAPVVAVKNAASAVIRFIDQAGNVCSRTNAGCSEIDSEGFDLIVTGAQ